MFKVMVIDAEKYFLRVVGDELQKDYGLLACAEGAKAAKLYRVFSPDAVVLDPLTPGLGPGNFISHLRQIPGKPVQIIVASYSALIRQIEESFDWGADYYFFKPVLPTRIRFKIRELLGKSLAAPPSGNPFPPLEPSF